MPNPRKKLLPWGIGRTIDKIQKLDDKGRVYFMDYKANYYTLEKYAAMLANAKPGCSSFLAKGTEGEPIFGRNYDFSHFRYNKRSDNKDDLTVLIFVVKASNPKAKYKSIGVADGFWLDNANGTFFEGVPSDGKTNVTALAMIPFIIMDGMNEVGLVTSIMHLPTENDWQEVDYRDPESLDEKEKAGLIIYEEPGQVPERLQWNVRSNAYAINTADHKTWKVNKNLSVRQNDPDKENIMHPILMRKMLDYCSTVDEAIEMAKSYNLVSPLPDNDYHVMIADRSGKSVVLEWVNNKMNIVETNHATNFHLSREDHYGYGEDRYEIIEKGLAEKPVMTESEVTDLCVQATQNPFKDEKAGFTEWSSVYNLSKKTLKLSVCLDYSKQYEYSV